MLKKNAQTGIIRHVLLYNTARVKKIGFNNHLNHKQCITLSLCFQADHLLFRILHINSLLIKKNVLTADLKQNRTNAKLSV